MTTKPRDLKRHFDHLNDEPPLEATPTWSRVQYLRMDAFFVRAMLHAIDSGLETCEYTSNRGN